MTKPTLAERFARDNGAPQELDGMLVHGIYRREIQHGTHVAVRRLEAISRPVQGIRINIKKGVAVIDQRKFGDVVLWADTAPEQVDFTCEIPKKASAQIAVWNCWRDEKGVTQAWLGNSGMLIEEVDDRVLLRCSSGNGDFAPDDLVVELRLGTDVGR